MGQVSRLERWHENFATGPFNAEREQRLLENAVRTAQRLSLIHISSASRGFATSEKGTRREREATSSPLARW